MVYRKDDYYDKIKNFTKTNFEVVMDFDKTITSDESLISWELFNNRRVLPKEYDLERDTLYNYYHPIEVDLEVDDAVKLVAMEDWVNKHLDLFKKYQLNKNQITEVLSDKNIMIFRKGFLEFFHYLDSNNIKLDILSAGIGDFFLKFLELNNCDVNNMDVKSNFLNFDRNGIVIGFKDKIVTSFNKYQFAFKKEDKDYVILIGDQVSDMMMVDGYPRENILAIAFVNAGRENEMESFKDVYDMILTSDEGFRHILNDLKNVIDK